MCICWLICNAPKMAGLCFYIEGRKEGGMKNEDSVGAREEA